MINDCINEVKLALKINPKKLYATLVNERLNLALKSYYADLSSKFSTYENQATKNAAKVLKKLI